MKNELQPIGILTAMQVEIEAILEAAAELTVQEHASMKFYTGLLSGTPFVAAQCSPGKVNSALCAQVMADFYHPRLLLNIGVAGGIGPGVAIGDVVIATACVQYDYDAHRGVIATGDRFVADPNFGKWLYETFGALACEMEGASTAHACLLNGIPCAVLRTISDNGNEEATVDFPTFARESAHKAQKLLAGVIQTL